MPPMVGGIFYEHGHRMAAAVVGLLTLVLAVWTARAETRAWRAPHWPGLALAGRRRPGRAGRPHRALPAAHADLGRPRLPGPDLLLPDCCSLAYVTSREWFDAAPRAADGSASGPPRSSARLVVYAQLLLGALMRHMGAGLAIPDFPLVFGGLDPAAWTPGIAVHYAHRLGAVAVVAQLRAARACAAAAAATRAWRGTPALLAGLLLVQLALGAATVLTGKAVLPTTAHVATGAAVLGGAWLLTLRARRCLQPPQRSAARPAARRAAATA